MRTNHILFITSIFFLFLSCNTENRFPTDKKYWDIEDYDYVVRELRFGFKPDEKLPTFDDPENKVIVEKLTDQNNFKVILDDEELGLKHKNEIGQKFFKVWQDMNDIYSQLDRKDIYLYEKERIEVFNFGMALQLRYFKLGNEEIKSKADDPNATNIQEVLNSNVNTLIGNYAFYLDEINNEKSYSNLGLDLIANGIDNYFTELVTLYPNADYEELKNKILLLSKKTKSENIRTALLKLQKLIESKKQNSQA